MSEELNMENIEGLKDSFDVEMTEADFGPAASDMEAVSDDDLDNVAGGAGQSIGTKLYLVTKTGAGFNTALPLGRRQIASLRRGQYLKNCRLVKVIGSGDWVNYAAYGASRNGPWNAQNGWTPAEICVLISY